MEYYYYYYYESFILNHDIFYTTNDFINQGNTLLTEKTLRQILTLTLITYTLEKFAG